MNEPSPSQLELWQRRLQRLRTQAWRAVPFVSGIIAAFVALLLYNFFVPGPHQLTTNEVNDSVAQALASVTPAPALSASVYQAILPSFVLIQVESPGKNGKPDYGVGSGVIIDDAGDILTSLHVVTDTVAITLTFADGTESSAAVMVKQPENDIAVLHSDKLPKQVIPAVLGNPNAMRIGDEAFVVGNPLGLYGSMSSGVISGLNRSFHPVNSPQRLKGLIQIDAAVNPGNSGGPLLNRAGQVIGIVAGLTIPPSKMSLSALALRYRSMLQAVLLACHLIKLTEIVCMKTVISE